MMISIQLSLFQGTSRDVKKILKDAWIHFLAQTINEQRTEEVNISDTDELSALRFKRNDQCF